MSGGKILGSFTPTGRSIVKPPDNGSFPLDHDGVCKEAMQKYMTCLRKNNGDNSKCRHESKDYLSCRMDKNLMQRESWQKLGYADISVPENT